MTEPRSDLRVGRRTVTLSQARTWIESDTTGHRDRYGYPAYDTFRSASRFQPLDEADLLAPTLLNHTPEPEVYFWLVDQLGPLNQALSDIPADADLAGSQTSPVLLAPLFGVLDGHRPAALTVLSEVLHRKRPGFVPLWDSTLGACYSVGDAAPLRLVRNRGFGEFAVAVAEAMRNDLQASHQWTSLAGIPSQSPITALRALHLVARNLSSPHRAPLPRSA